MDRRDLLKLGGSAVVAGTLAAKTTMPAEVRFADFTRGRWKTQSLPIFDM